jgi:inosine/xanthosine triphosphatase
MDVCRILVGSTRKPKLQAVQEAVTAFAEKLCSGGDLEIRSCEGESGVGHTPVSREDLMRGARQRAEALVAKYAQTENRAEYYVGLEGGFDVVQENGIRRVFLQSWAYVTDGERGHFGCSGLVEVPNALADDVVNRGTELSVAIDHFAGVVGVRDAQGAWGVLTDNLIVRQESFRLAVLAAFAPFYNARMYRDAGAAAGA